MKLQQKQTLLVKYLTDQKFHDYVISNQSEESEFLKSFNQEAIKNFIKGHNAKRRLRFSTILNKSFKNIIKNNRKYIINEFFYSYPYQGQRPYKDMQDFVSFIQNNNDLKDLYNLARHELNIYSISNRMDNYIIQRYILLSEYGIDDGAYIYIKDYTSNKVNMKKIDDEIFEIIERYGIENQDIINIIFQKDEKLYRLLKGG